MSNTRIAAENFIVATTPEDLKNKLKAAIERISAEKNVQYLVVTQPNDEFVLRIDASKDVLEFWHRNSVDRSASPFLKNILRDYLPAGVELSNSLHDFYELNKDEVIQRTLTGEEQERKTPEQIVKSIELAISTKAWDVAKQKKLDQEKFHLPKVPAPSAQPSTTKGWVFRFFPKHEKETPGASKKEAAKKETAVASREKTPSGPKPPR